MYKEYMLTKINEVIHDELNAAIIYFKMAESLEGIGIEEVVEILKKHGNEEFEHFTRILSYAQNHNLSPIININSTLINTAPTELISVILRTQELEDKAIKDYTEMARIAQENNDIETHHFFKTLMETEMEHYDELAPFIGQKRELPCGNKEENKIEDDSVVTPPVITLRSILGI